MKYKILITAGPTIEYIDPVRFLSNASSGKMGAYLANAFDQAGADVTVISSITDLPLNKDIDFVQVTSAKDMFKAVKQNSKTCHCLVMAAAVADYTPQEVSKTKIKKSDNQLTIKLKPTVDILKWAGQNKSPRQILAGFALEDTDIKPRAEKKLRDKNLDVIIANCPGAIGAESSEILIKKANSDWQRLGKTKKQDSAEKIARLIIQLLEN